MILKPSIPRLMSNSKQFQKYNQRKNYDIDSWISTSIQYIQYYNNYSVKLILSHKSVFQINFVLYILCINCVSILILKYIKQILIVRYTVPTLVTSRCFSANCQFYLKSYSQNNCIIPRGLANRVSKRLPHQPQSRGWTTPESRSCRKAPATDPGPPLRYCHKNTVLNKLVIN